MSSSKLILMTTTALALAACTREAGTTKTTTQTETKQVGSTTESKTETTVDTASGDRTSVVNRYVGTVTEFTPGKNIEVMTGNKDTHAFDLSDKAVVLEIDPSTSVGAKVELVEEKGEKGFHRISVTIAPPA